MNTKKRIQKYKLQKS